MAKSKPKAKSSKRTSRSKSRSSASEKKVKRGSKKVASERKIKKRQQSSTTAKLALQMGVMPPAPDPPGMNCSDGWRVTGYYTPVEAEFHGAPQQINIAGKGSDSFPADFLAAVRMEGWGQTRYGWFLGYDRTYSSSADPQSALGKPLAVGSLAADKNEIPFGSLVRINSLPPPWNNQLFVANDVGSMINQKHVDVYCGTGSAANAQTMQITTDNVRLCQSGPVRDS